MKSVVGLLSLIGSAAAFAPVKQGRATVSVNALTDYPGATAPFKGFDPLGLADIGSDSTFAWFRAAELKHGRVAMLATTGYLVQGAGIHFPGMLSPSENISFESLSAMKPLDAWDALPDTGKSQIYFFILLAELVSESKEVHYTKGGELPTIVFPPVNFASTDADKLAAAQNRELNNGRLAMIGIMSFVAAANLPGSVPMLEGNPAF